METVNSSELYFDPFAEEGEQEFNPMEAFAKIEQNYLDNKVEHDTAADEFVKGAEALMLDSKFNERFAELEAIAARMHELCGEDHGLNQAMQSSEILGKSHEDHDHEDALKFDKKDDKESKKDKKKKKRRSWFGVYY